MPSHIPKLLFISLMLSLMVLGSVHAQTDHRRDVPPSITIISSCRDPVYISNTSWGDHKPVKLDPENTYLFDWLYAHPSDGSFTINIATTDTPDSNWLEVEYSLAWGGFFWSVRYVGDGPGIENVWLGTTGCNCPSAFVDYGGNVTWFGEGGGPNVSCERPQSFWWDLCTW